MGITGITPPVHRAAILAARAILDSDHRGEAIVCKGSGSMISGKIALGTKGHHGFFHRPLTRDLSASN